MPSSHMNALIPLTFLYPLRPLHGIFVYVSWGFCNLLSLWHFSFLKPMTKKKKKVLWINPSISYNPSFLPYPPWTMLFNEPSPSEDRGNLTIFRSNVIIKSCKHLMGHTLVKHASCFSTNFLQSLSYISETSLMFLH